MVERPDVQVAELERIPSGVLRLSIFQKQLAMPGKKVAPDLLERIVCKKRNITPLQLAVLASDLRLCRPLIVELQSVDDYLEALSYEQIWSFLIHRWVKEYSWTCERHRKGKKAKQNFASAELREMKGWVLDVLCLLCVSRCGLSDDDILHLLRIMGYRDQYEVTSLHWAAFRAASWKWIQEKPDGLLHISHRSGQDAIDHLLLGTSVPTNDNMDNTFQNTMNIKRRRIHQLLIKYFMQLGLSRRVYEEVPWHLKMIGNLSEMCGFLLNTRYLDCISRSTRFGYQMKMDFINFWHFLSASGKDLALKYNLMIGNNAEEMNMRELTDRCRVVCFAAQCLNNIGKTSEAEKMLSSVVSRLENSTLDKKSIIVLLWTCKSIGDLHTDTASWQKASVYYQKALHTFESITAQDVEDDAQLLKLQGQLKCKLAVSNAIQSSGQESKTFEEAINHFQSISPGPYENAALQLCQGLLKLAVGNFSESESHLKDCHEMRCKLYGKRHIRSGEVLEYRADLKSHPRNNTYSHRLQALENYKEVIHIKEAAEELSQSTEMKETLTLSLSNTLLKAGNILCQADFGTYKEAIGMLQRSLDLRTSILGLEHPLSNEVQCFLKEVKRKVCSSKGHFGLEKQANPIEHKHIQDNKELFHFPPLWQHTNELPKPTPESFVFMDDNKHEFNDLQTEPTAQTAKSPLLQQRKLQSSQDKKVLCNKQNSNSKEDGCIEILPVYLTRALSVKRPTSTTNRVTSACVSRPVSVCQTSLSGPSSSIVALAPFSRPVSRSKTPEFTHKSAWYHVPGRYATLEVPLPPKRHQLRKTM
ncbi:putative tetratricopeptide repeat protein 41 [Pelobates fuscus]|uniref:putative tetratricopeptide repeat protein 41 n=1 Tax=Pelobates fuscus TaxID=191477 RepID=UPI002FE4A3A6